MVSACTNLVLVQFDSKLLPPINKYTQPNQLKCVLFGARYSGFYIADNSGQTILHKAARSGNIQLIYYCIRTIGSDLLSLGDIKKRIALYSAVENNQLNAARALLKLGSPVNVLRGKGYIPTSTPLWYAAQIAHNVAMCEILLRYDGVAFPEVKGFRGKQILEQAQANIRWRKNVYMTILYHFAPLPVVTNAIITDFLR
jgi:ankyrin repeat protein